jgi:putative ABC transport system substrate-binding protein
MSTRREFITLLGSAAAAWPLAARTAHTQSKTLRLGIAAASPRTSIQWVAFDRRLSQLGYVEGQNLTVEFLNTGDRVGQYDRATQELVRRGIDILMLDGEEALIKAAAATTSTLPIVMVAISFDPVARGYVASLARPGKNVTGVYFRRPEFVEKQLDLLAQAFPERTRLGVLYDAGTADMFDGAVRAAVALRMELRPVKLENPPYDFVAAFRTVAEAGAQVLLILSSSYFNRDRPQLAALALQHNLPTMFTNKAYAEAGGLMSYGPSFGAMYGRAADYVHRIAQGTKPSDLPIEQPTKFELVINLRTARALGFTVPPAQLVAADEVIE